MSEKIKIKVHEALQTKPVQGMSTSEIFDYVNEHSKHGTTMNELSPLLAQDPQINKAGDIVVERLNRRRTRQCIWKWRE